MDAARKMLRTTEACKDGRAWLKEFDTLQQAWDECSNPDWMLGFMWFCGMKRQATALVAEAAFEAPPRWCETDERGTTTTLTVEDPVQVWRDWLRELVGSNDFDAWWVFSDFPSDVHYDEKLPDVIRKQYPEVPTVPETDAPA